MVAIPFCGSAQPKALAVFFLSVIGSIIGASLVFNQLLVQTPNDEQYEGYFNAANYHVLTLVAIILINCGTSMYNYGGFASKVWKYLAFPAAGILIVWITGTIEPHAGALSWVSMSYANINTLRIAWEGRGKDGETLDEFENFSRGELLKTYGLTDQFVVVNSELAADESVTLEEQVDDYHVAFTGVIFLLVTLVLSGSISNGYYGMAFKGPLGSQGWSKNYQSAVVFSMLAFIFGFVATFVAWSSDAGADPTHAFYETVMGIASYQLIAATVVASAVQLESRFLAEIAVFLSGFFLLSGPVKLWQMKSLIRSGIKISGYDYTDADGRYLESIVSAETDRYAIAVVLGIFQAIATIYAVIKLLGDASFKSIDFDAVGYRADAKPWKKNIMHYVFLSLGFVMVIVACALDWSVARSALKSIGAEDTDRMDAANWYILLLLIAEGCLVVQFFENSLPSLKPLWWVACGISASVIAGFSNIGTHDRQLWMIDFSFAGVNELREYLEKDDKDDFLPPKRAIGPAESDYEQAFAADLLFYIGFMISWVFTMKIPFSSCGSTVHWDRNTGVYSFAKVKSWATIFVIFAFLFYVIAVGIMAASDLAHPPISQQNVTTKLTGDFAPATSNCEGEHFNMYLDTTTAGAYNCLEFAGENTWAGERFTINLMTSWVPTDRKYWELLTFISIGFMGTVLVTAGWLHGDARSVKAAALISGITWLSLEYAMAWDVDNSNSTVVESAEYRAMYPNPTYGSILQDFGCDDGNDNGECSQYKSGFVILFLASVFTIFASMTMLSTLDDAIEGEHAIAPSTPSRSIPGDAQAITQEELQMAISTPEKAMELARRIQEQGYLSVAAAEPAAAAPSTMV
jgi:hypothetical protein